MKKIYWFRIGLLVSLLIAFTLNGWVGGMLALGCLYFSIDRDEKLINGVMWLWMFVYCSLALPLAIGLIAAVSGIIGSVFTWLGNNAERVANWGMSNIFIYALLSIGVGICLMVYIRVHKISTPKK